MSVYAVYEPPSEETDIESRAERLVFIKEGFSWGALLVPGLWLIWRSMWIEFIAFVALFVLLAWVFSGTALGEAAYAWLSLAIILLFAFEANDLRCASLERRGFRLAGTASGPDRESAELSFFRSWLPEQERAPRRPVLPERKAKPGGGAAQRPAAEGEEVIGLFPRP